MVKYLLNEALPLDSFQGIDWHRDLALLQKLRYFVVILTNCIQTATLSSKWMQCVYVRRGVGGSSINVVGIIQAWHNLPQALPRLRQG